MGLPAGAQVPAGQALQVPEPGVEEKPAGHTLQVFEPSWLAYQPEEQGLHTSEPRSGAKVPMPHGLYVMAPVVFTK